MPITPAQIPVTPGSGLILDAVQVTVGATAVDRETIVLADPLTAGNYANVTSAGALQVDGSGVTQPISGTVTANVGTGTQPVSGTVAVSNFPATQPVSGSVTATQATGTNLHVVVDSAPTTPVTGTFFQSTQPVSLPAGQAVELLDSGGTNKASISAAGAVKVDGSAVTQPISGTVSVAAAQTIAVTQATAANLNATVTGTVTANDVPPTLTKGTQGSTGFSVQELKDAGRTQVTLWVDAIAGVATETLATMNITKGGVAQSTATSYTVTTGKTLRIQSIAFEANNSATAVALSRLRVRQAASALATTSAAIITLSLGGIAAVTSAGNSQMMSIPDGLEVPATNVIGLSHIENTTASAVSACLIAYEY